MYIALPRLTFVKCLNNIVSFWGNRSNYAREGDVAACSGALTQKRLWFWFFSTCRELRHNEPILVPDMFLKIRLTGCSVLAALLRALVLLVMDLSWLGLLNRLRLAMTINFYTKDCLSRLNYTSLVPDLSVKISSVGRCEAWTSVWAACGKLEGALQEDFQMLKLLLDCLPRRNILSLVPDLSMMNCFMGCLLVCTLDWAVPRDILDTWSPLMTELSIRCCFPFGLLRRFFFSLVQDNGGSEVWADVSGFGCLDLFQDSSVKLDVQSSRHSFFVVA